MKQKTIKLSNYDFSIIDGAVMYRDYDYEKKSGRWVPSRYRIGAECVLVSKTDLSPNALKSGKLKEAFRLNFDELDGIGGNSNTNIKRYHGWRGTNNDKAIYAYGLRKIIRVRGLCNGDIAVTVGPDMLPDED